MDAYVHVAFGAAIGVIAKNSAKLVFPDLDRDGERSFSGKLAHALELGTAYGVGFTGAVLSHVFLDMLPHGDYVAYYGLFLPDSLWLLREFLAALFVLFLLVVILRGRSRLAALACGIGGTLLDLDNLAIKMGVIERWQALSPSHSGVWPHGQDIGAISFVLEMGTFLLAMGLLVVIGWCERPRAVSARQANPRVVG